MMQPTDRRAAERRNTGAILLMLGLLPLAAVGCSRAFYRHQADREVHAVVDCAANDPRWPLENYTIEPDPVSRMFDPSCPDCPPMPPDDPTSHRLMHCVDCKQGSPCWRCYGKTPFVENPHWRECLPYDEHGDLVLNREGAVQVALVNSREYQRALEDLYLSALDVTFERFRFDVQFFGGNSTFYTVDGPDRAGGEQSTLSTDTGLEARKLFATGGELIVGMANSLVWQFAGPDEYGANTLLDFSLVQPLLRAGGRAVVLEALTDSERALLANIRQMERFRRGFYTQIVSGRDLPPGPTRGGPGSGGISLTALRSAGGFLGLLRQQVEIRNQRSNMAGLRSSLDRLQAFYEGGLVSSQHVGLTRQGLYRAQSDLLRVQADYQRGLDAYKIQLGLPPDLPLKIEDRLLARFDLIDPTLRQVQDTVAAFLARLRSAADAEAEAKAGAGAVTWQPGRIYGPQTIAASFHRTGPPEATVGSGRPIGPPGPSEPPATVFQANQFALNADAANYAMPRPQPAERATRFGHDGRVMHATGEIAFAHGVPASETNRSAEFALFTQPDVPGAHSVRPLPPTVVVTGHTARQIPESERLFSTEDRARPLILAAPQDPNGAWEYEVSNIRQIAAAQLDLVRNDVGQLIASLPVREESLRRLVSREEFQRGEVDPIIFSSEGLRRRAVQLVQELDGFEPARVLAGRLGVALEPEEEPQPGEPLAQSWERKPVAVRLEIGSAEIGQWQQAAALPNADRAALLAQLIALVHRLSGDLLDLSLIQAQARLDTVTLEPIELEPQRAYQIARVYRRDWMNARARLVDAWRQIEVAANDLRSDLDLTFSGDINTLDNNPLNFRASTGRLRLGLEFDAPLTRLVERNFYRETLINYQRARRDYYTFEDRVSASLRDEIRSIRLNQLNFELQRAAVFVAIARVDEAGERLSQPGGAQLGVTTARDLVEALDALLQAQNNFLGVWVNQEALRMNLDLDLGTMELDQWGVWIDPGSVGAVDLPGDGRLEPAPFPAGVIEEIPVPPAAD